MNSSNLGSSNIAISNISIRTIQPQDNPGIASIIRDTLTEFGANKPGTVFYDKSTDHLFELFQQPGSQYHIAFNGNEMLGGAGIFPSPGLPANTCELVKMYLTSSARGIGLGKLLIEKSLQFAADAGYRHVYLETMPELSKAMSVYEKFGFRYLDGPIGETGHFGCAIWMLKDF